MYGGIIGSNKENARAPPYIFREGKGGPRAFSLFEANYYYYYSKALEWNYSNDLAIARD